MPVLYLDRVPEELFRRIEELATADRVPVAEATIQLLQQAVARRQPGDGAMARSNVLAVLERIRRSPIVPAPGTPDSVEVLREDRQR